MKKRLLATIPVLLVVFLCFTFPVSASTVQIEERLNTTDVQNQDPDDADKKIVINTYNTISRPYYVSYDHDFIVHREYYGTNNSSVYNWWSQDLSHMYQVDYTCTVTVSNRYDYLAYGDIGYISVLPNFTYAKTPNCYWIECVTDGLVLSDVTNNGTLKFRYAPSDYSYYGRLAVPGNAAINVTFIVHFLYDEYYGYNNSTVVTNGGTLFSSTANYMDISSVSLVQPSYWTLTNVDVNGNHLVNEWRIIEWLKLLTNKFSDQRQAYIDTSPQSQTVTSESSSLQTQSDTVHNQESSYYTQTNTALSNTGLSNFSFSPNVVGGLGKVKDQFTYVWNKLGDYKDVYLFSMIFGISLMIIRHVRPIRRKKEE